MSETLADQIGNLGVDGPSARRFASLINEFARLYRIADATPADAEAVRKLLINYKRMSADEVTDPLVVLQRTLQTVLQYEKALTESEGEFAALQVQLRNANGQIEQMRRQLDRPPTAVCQHLNLGEPMGEFANGNVCVCQGCNCLILVPRSGT